MDSIRPSTPEEVAGSLKDAADAGRRIRLGGAFSKDGMAGPLAASDLCLSTARLTRVRQYEPKDLTVSVEAGMPWADLTALLARDGQMIPLDPPWFDRATVGGVIASNSSGPRRRLYGSARDVVIGMEFATLEGKLVQSGGMVVKNVAGLDMGKLMIGSFGTLAAITSVNFKLTPVPESVRTFVFSFTGLQEAIAQRDRILQDVLQPSAIDLLNPAASDRVGLKGYCLLVQASGVEAVLDRYGRELQGAVTLGPDDQHHLWRGVREFVPEFLAEYPGGSVLRYSTTLAGVRDILAKRNEPAVSRAGTGVTYVCLQDGAETSAPKGAVLEYSPVSAKEKLELWPHPGGQFEVMKKIKAMFDPQGLLNPGRLYGRI